MRTVLWGRRRGDVQYNSRAYWRRNIPIGAMTVTCDVRYFDPWDIIELVGGYRPTGGVYRIIGRDPVARMLGLERVPA